MQKCWGALTQASAEIRATAAAIAAEKCIMDHQDQHRSVLRVCFRLNHGQNSDSCLPERSRNLRENARPIIYSQPQIIFGE